MERKVNCIICPVGCEITAETQGDQMVSCKGFACKRGRVYAQNEVTNPTRILTTTVLTAAGVQIPVRSDAPLPKERVMECMELIRRFTAKGPVARYDVLISDILGLGANIIASAPDR